MSYLLSVLGFVISYRAVNIIMSYFNIYKPSKNYNKKKIFIMQGIVTIIIAFIFAYSNNTIGIVYGIVTGSILSLISSFLEMK